MNMIETGEEDADGVKMNMFQVYTIRLIPREKPVISRNTTKESVILDPNWIHKLWAKWKIGQKSKEGGQITGHRYAHGQGGQRRTSATQESKTSSSQPETFYGSPDATELLQQVEDDSAPQQRSHPELIEIGGDKAKDEVSSESHSRQTLSDDRYLVEEPLYI